MRRAVCFVALLAAAILVFVPAPRRITYLPRGVVYLKSEFAVAANTELRGAPSGTILRFASDFQGRALIVVTGSGVVLRNFTLDGARATDPRFGLPSYATTFAQFTRGNGILAEYVTGLRIESVHARNISGFAVLASRCRDVQIDRVEVSDSGSRNSAGRNNTTGGILLEEGTRDFRVTRCEFSNVRGNGIWTHSLYTSPRNANGLIAFNRFALIGRDAIQVGHATNVRVENNSGRAIGYPAEDVDAIPVAIDTAGNVDRSGYTANRFDDIAGKCIDLDGFHDGEVRGNVCVNLANFGIVMNNTNPDMQSRNILVIDNLIDTVRYGGIFVIGSGHRIVGNRLLNLNTAHCGCTYSLDDPDILSAGIYLGRGAERPGPARGNVIEDNEIQGYQMKTRCILNAPGISPQWNVERDNRCRQ